jgi:hypothetical protein
MHAAMQRQAAGFVWIRLSHRRVSASVLSILDTVEATFSPYSVELSDGYVVDAETSFCAERFANHSSNLDEINFVLVEGALGKDDRFPILHQIKEFLPANTEVLWDYNSQL